MNVRWHNIAFTVLVGVTTNLMGLTWAADAAGAATLQEKPALEMTSPAQEAPPRSHQ